MRELMLKSTPRYRNNGPPLAADNVLILRPLT